MITVTSHTNKTTKSVRIHYYDPVTQKQCTVTVGTLGSDVNRAQVESLCEKARTRIHGGWNPFLSTDRHPSPSLDSIFKQYIKHTGERYRPDTLRIRSGYVGLFIEKMTERGVEIAEINKDHIQSFVEVEGLTEGTRRVRLSCLTSFLEFALAHDYIVGNVARKYAKLRGKGSSVIRAGEESRKRAFTLEEVASFSAAMASERDGTAYIPYRDAFLFACATGLRRGTIADMRVKHIVRNGSRMRTNIPGSIMKGGKEHQVPLTRRAEHILSRYMTGDPEDYLFRSINGAPLLRKRMTAVVREARKAHGLPWQEIGFHSTRYTFVYFLSALQVPFAQSMNLVAHLASSVHAKYATSSSLLDAVAGVDPRPEILEFLTMQPREVVLADMASKTPLQQVFA